MPVSKTGCWCTPKHAPSFHCQFISSQGCLSYSSTIHSHEIKPCPITEAHRYGKPGTPVTMVMARWKETTGRSIEACRPDSLDSVAAVQANERQKVEILVDQNLRLPSDLHTGTVHMCRTTNIHTHNTNMYVYTYIRVSWHSVRVKIQLLSHIGHRSTAQ